jgi:hypothetical protein
MPISEILIVYLAFGAPLAVYRYLETRKVSRRRRILMSLVTFGFWVPFAVRLSLRHFTNASFDGDFVSPSRRKRSESVTNDRQEALRTAIAEAGCPLPRHDLREVIERYAGLSEAATDLGSTLPGEKAVNFFEAAGRPTDIGARCLSRRERARFQRHLDDSRLSFLTLFDQLTGPGSARNRAIRRAVELALVLNDMEAADRLGEIQYDLELADRQEPVAMKVPASNFSIRPAAPFVE